VTRNDDWLELRDEVCVVTGAAGGLGVSIVRQLLQAGAAVALLDLDLTGAREVVAECDPEGTRTVMLRCDVTQAASVEEAVAAVGTKLGTPGVLVNNAGVIRAGALESIAIEDWQGQLDVNLTGYFRCAQLFGRQMLARGRGPAAGRTRRRRPPSACWRANSHSSGARAACAATPSARG
jgi:NAD(P)-dependent dehydrogenase (short-subunit alcohol dehydrogenase family)